MASIRFLLDGREITVEDPPPTLTVLEFLRDHLRRTGTKEGCAEGDCGACTVVLGTATGNGVEYRAINSCIRFLASIDGHELVTVESLQAADGTLHPVQQAMVDQHASQCGFCTPGFVMSLFALYLQDPEPGRDQVLEALSGNLCRCTGYRPIIEAGCRMGSYPTPAHWGPQSAAAPERRDALLAIRPTEALRLPGFHAPRSLAELDAALADRPDALVLAGGTDIGLMVTKQLRELPPIVYLGAVGELAQLREEPTQLVIGAAVTLTDAWRAIVALYPQLAGLAERFGSPPVRNSGTLCGNLANGSPIGDALPVLIALGSTLELRRAGRTRRVALDDFYVGYQRKDLAAGEYLAAVCVPRPVPGRIVACYKVSKRHDQDISAVCGAFAVDIDAGRIQAARVAYGGMAPTVRRASATERALNGAPAGAATFDAAARQLGADYQPISDLRASAAYRLEAAANLLRRFHLEACGAPS